MFSVCIIAPIMIITKSIGDSLVLLISFLLLWIATFTLFMQFMPKFMSIWTVGSDAVATMSTHVSGGFSFQSVLCACNPTLAHQHC